jgi:hypothetical protein
MQRERAWRALAALPTCLMGCVRCSGFLHACNVSLVPVGLQSHSCKHTSLQSLLVLQQCVGCAVLPPNCTSSAPMAFAAG